MAKRRSTALARVPQMVVVAPTRRSRAGAVARRAGGALKRGSRRAGRAVGGAVWKQKDTIASVAGAGLIGYLEGAKKLEFVPDFGLGRVPTLAVATYAAGAMLKSPKLKNAGVGLAAAAAFGYGLDKGRS